MTAKSSSTVDPDSVLTGGSYIPPTYTHPPQSDFQSPAIDKLAKALVKLQGSLPKAHKGANNPFFKTKYADLASVMEVIQKPLADNGFAIISTMDYDADFPNSIVIITTLLHESGQWLRGRILMQVSLGGGRTAPNPQEIGSMITYGRRYGISAMLSLTTEEDDDGALASGTAVQMGKEVFPGAVEVTVDTLTAALEEAGVGIIKVLDHYKVHSLQELTQEQLIESYQRTTKTLKKQKGGK